VRTSIPEIVSRSIEVEQSHTVRAIEALIEHTEQTLDNQIAERGDALDAYFQTLRDSEEPIRLQKAAEELSGLIHFQLRLNGEQSRLLTDEPEEFKKWLEEYVEANLIGINANRVIGAIERRLNEPLGLKVDGSSWNETANQILGAGRELMKRQREQLTAQVQRDLETVLQREAANDDSSKLRVLLSLSQGVRTLFDQRTHRQLRQVFSRFTYVYLAAHLLENRTAEDVTDAVLEHLEQAESALQTTWGQSEFARLSQNAAKLSDFGPAAKVFGEERQSEAPSALSESEREQLIQAIGSYILNEVKRQLLLGAITELWVEYLTKVEALRVSIGLEAYAQRDPLVQYKGKASELFQQLLADVRSAVIGRVFSYQPRRIEITPTEVAETPAGTHETQAESNKKKRKRH
jgi:preprotein translocase subunit SecA